MPFTIKKSNPIGPDPKESPALLKAMQTIHPQFKLGGNPRNSLFEIQEDLLEYIVSFLKNKPCPPPKVSTEKWSFALSNLKPHWILPLLYWTIGRAEKQWQPPESVILGMRKVFLESRARCFHAERQITEILQAFQEEGVQALVLRGPALARSVYPDPALRPSSDLDLLVEPEQVVQARRILEKLDYQCLGSRFEAAGDFFREEEFVHRANPGQNLPVDLHWIHWELHPFLTSRQKVKISDLFHREHQISTPHLTFQTLEPVDALIHAAIHLMWIHSRDIRLIWIYDITLLANQLRVPEDWELLLERSVEWRARLALEKSLRMAQLWFAFALPKGFLDFTLWPKPTKQELEAWSQSTKQHWMAILVRRYLRKPSDLLKSVRALFFVLFPHPKIVRYCYPTRHNWLLPVSYVRRWHRWFVELIINGIKSSRRV